MLNERVCEKCHKLYGKLKGIVSQERIWTFSSGPWPSAYEFWHEDGFVWCHLPKNVKCSIDSPPPVWCPFRFEHAVARGKGEKVC